MSQLLKDSAIFTERLISHRMRAIIWKDVSMPAYKGTHWDVRFFPVENSPKKVCLKKKH